jgi:hypothetical protein
MSKIEQSVSEFLPELVMGHRVLLTRDRQVAWRAGRSRPS